MTTGEVANHLRIAPKTLRNYGVQHPVYRGSKPGVFHVAHVRIIEKVRAGALTEDEGMAFWKLEQGRMGKSARHRARRGRKTY